MGLTTVDVTSAGVVVTSDSQPVDIYPQHVAMPADPSVLENHIVRVELADFVGFGSYVGTIAIGRRSTRDWLVASLERQREASLNSACAAIATELTAIWTELHLETWLSIFVAGYDQGAEPRYWYVSNGGFPSGEVRFPTTFTAVNDLDDVWLPNAAAPGESKDAVLARVHPSFRRGVMSAAAIFDSFSSAVEETLKAGHAEFQPFDSLNRFAAYTRFRFEFTKRMYNPLYGIAVDPHPPVRGEVRVVSIDRSGVRRKHGKHVADVTVLT